MKYFITTCPPGIHWSEALGTYEEEDFRPVISNSRTFKNDLKIVRIMHTSRWELLKPWFRKLGYNPGTCTVNHHPRDSDTSVHSSHYHQPALSQTEHSTIRTDRVSIKDQAPCQTTWCFRFPPQAQIGTSLKGLSFLNSCPFKSTSHYYENQ